MRQFLLTLFFAYSACSLQKTSLGDERIAGGESARDGQFNFAAAIYITRTKDHNTDFCGGSLVSRQWVLTAGHCVDGAQQFFIYLGTHDLQSDNHGKKFVTSTYVLHPEYNPETYANDIGLIKLHLPLTLTDDINKVLLPKAPFADGAVGTALGWGQISDDAFQHNFNLRYVNLKALSSDECEMTYGRAISEHICCFAGVNSNQQVGTCLGDTGSPLVQAASVKSFEVLAIATVLRSEECESAGPSSYVAIYPYNKWINNIIRV